MSNPQVHITQSAQSYTIALMDSFVKGLVEQKASYGIQQMRNGLFEDVVGNVMAVDIKQHSQAMHVGTEEAYSIQHVTVSMKKADIANF